MAHCRTCGGLVYRVLGCRWCIGCYFHVRPDDWPDPFGAIMATGDQPREQQRIAARDVGRVPPAVAGGEQPQNEPPKLRPFAHNKGIAAPLVTIDEHEDRRNGLACPQCGAEMRDLGNLLQTTPTTVRVECTNRACGYIDTRRVGEPPPKQQREGRQSPQPDPNKGASLTERK